MYSVKCHADGRFVSDWLCGENDALYVVVETPEPRRFAAPVADLLSHTIARSQPMLPGAPGRLAECLIDALRADNNRSLPGFLIFAAVLAKPDRVEVTVAGYHRVHLIVSNETVVSSREHILSKDPESAMELYKGLPSSWDVDEFRSAHQGLVTRSLSVKSTLPPETTIWETSGPYRVVVCCPDIHQDRDEIVYLSDIDATLAGTIGSIAVIDCI